MRANNRSRTQKIKNVAKIAAKTMLQPQAYPRQLVQQRIQENPSAYAGQNVSDLRKTIKAYRDRFAAGQPEWNPANPKNYALGSALQTHFAPVVKALIKTNTLNGEERGVLETMRSLIEERIGTVGTDTSQPVPAPAPAPAQAAENNVNLRTY